MFGPKYKMIHSYHLYLYHMSRYRIATKNIVYLFTLYTFVQNKRFGKIANKNCFKTEQY